MYVSVSIHWLMAGVAYILIKRVEVPPIQSWAVFCLMVMVLAAVLILRFRAGKWKSIKVIEEPVPQPPPELPPEAIE